MILLHFHSLFITPLHKKIYINKQQYQDGQRFIGPKYRITKKLAAEFWADSFGDRYLFFFIFSTTNNAVLRTIVTWEEFRDEFSKIHKIGIGIETHALKNTIGTFNFCGKQFRMFSQLEARFLDLTCNDHISNFEFDVFTRLFHPFPSLLKNWQVLAVTHPACMTYYKE